MERKRTLELPQGRERERLSLRFIRGHHLEMLADVVRNGETPEVLAARQRLGMQRRRTMAIGGRLEGERALVDDFNDTIGTTKQQMTQYQVDLADTFRQFLLFPSSYQVELVAGIPDAICACAAVGDHCPRRQSARREGMTGGAVDQLFLEAFVAEAKKLGMEENRAFTRGRRRAMYSDGSSEDLLSLSTTLGTVRSVLADSPLDWATVAPDPILDRDR